MKLWFQSCGNLGTDPGWKDYEISLTKHLKRVARLDTQIDLHGVKVWSSGVVSHRYHAFLNTTQIINNAIQAEREGYDAFAQTGTLDLGFYEVREAVSIPVVFPVETALHVAALLAPKIGFLVMNPAFLNYLNEKAILYGFNGRLTAGGSINISPKELQMSFKNPKPVIEMLDAEAKKIVLQGANVVICAGNPITMLCVEQGITELGGVRVLDSLGVAVKVTELMVDLQKMGIDRKNMGAYAPLLKDEVNIVRKVFNVE